MTVAFSVWCSLLLSVSCRRKVTLQVSAICGRYCWWVPRPTWSVCVCLRFVSELSLTEQSCLVEIC